MSSPLGRRIRLGSVALLPTLGLLAGCPIDDGSSDDGGSTGGVDTNPPPTTTADSTGGTTTPQPTSDTTVDPPTASDGPEPTTTGPDDGVTIYDIQMGNVAENTVVTLTDVVVTSPVQIADGGVTIQEPEGGPYSGIYVYMFDEVVTAHAGLQPGDIVTITGEYSEFFDFSELTVMSPDDIVVTGSGAAPDPLTVASADLVAGSADAESYEGVLVRAENLTASDATNMFGDFHVDDGLVITNFFLFEQGGELDVLPGTTLAFVQGPLLYNFDEFKIAPRTAADYDATVADCATAATAATIYEIQQGMFAPGELVNVADVIVTTPLTFDGDAFFVQDPTGGAYSGISVFVADPTGLSVTPGDQVSICGSYDEFFDQSQIELPTVAGITAAGTGPVPAPEVLTPDVVGGGAMAEMWEGVLVQVDAVTVTTTANMFGEWEVDNVLLTDDLFFAMMDWPTPALDTVFTNLRGVVTYSFGAYKLAPRDAADIVP